MQIARAQFGNYFLTTMLPSINAKLKSQLEMQPELRPLFLQDMTSTRSIEQSAGHTGVGKFRRKSEGKAIEFDNPVQKIPKTYVHESYALGVAFTFETIADDKFGLVNDSVAALAESEVDTTEMQGASIFNDGFTVNGYDGVPLFSASHPLEKAGGVQSNLLSVASDLSASSLEDAMVEYNLMTDATGKPIRRSAQYLLTSMYNEYNAIQITMSPDRSDTANRAINPLKHSDGGMPQPKMWRYLTDPDAWFLVGQRNGLRWFWRERPNSDNWVEHSTKTGNYVRIYRASWGYDHYFGIFATPGA